MRPNDAGRMAERCWLDIPTHFPHVEVDVFVVMPNHVHGILCITEPPPETGAGAERPVKGRPRGTSKTIGSVIRGFKIGVTTWIRQHEPGLTVWQRNYYEHVVRNPEDLHRIREYIVNNPARWAEDRENPACDKETPGIPDYPRRRF
jgi:REP element-mobilizing transposase RayT